MELYLSGQFGFIDDQDRQFGNSSVWTPTWTQGGCPEPVLTLAVMRFILLLFNYTAFTLIIDWQDLENALHHRVNQLDSGAYPPFPFILIGKCRIAESHNDRYIGITELATPEP